MADASKMHTPEAKAKRAESIAAHKASLPFHVGQKVRVTKEVCDRWMGSLSELDVTKPLEVLTVDSYGVHARSAEGKEAYFAHASLEAAIDHTELLVETTMTYEELPALEEPTSVQEYTGEVVQEIDVNWGGSQAHEKLVEFFNKNAPVEGSIAEACDPVDIGPRGHEGIQTLDSSFSIDPKVHTERVAVIGSDHIMIETTETRTMAESIQNAVDLAAVIREGGDPHAFVAEKMKVFPQSKRPWAQGPSVTGRTPAPNFAPAILPPYAKKDAELTMKLFETVRPEFEGRPSHELIKAPARLQDEFEPEDDDE